MRRALVVGEVALALVLLLGTGLLLRSMQRLLSQPLGLDPTRVVSMRVRLGGRLYRDDVRRAAFVDELVARARALPGVERAAATSSVPLTGYGLGMTFRPEGTPIPAPGQGAQSAVLLVTPDYFATMGVPLIAGRGFTEADGPDTAPVAIVNRSFAEKFFRGQEAVGKHIQFAISDKGPWVTIVGVTADTRHRGPTRPPEPEIFRPNRQMVTMQAVLAVRASVSPLTLVGALRAQVRQLDPELPVSDVMTMEARVARATASQRLELGLIGFFAAVATVLAALGVYGVIAHAVSQRTHEIGLRLALGAAPGRVLRSVAAGGMRMAVAGVVLGLAGGYGLTRYLRTLLFEVGEHDAITFAGASGVLLAMALLASWLPARRAARVDPVVALRCE
jgi:putative ABC transport system permease protein